jgi:hypothetical protein
MEGCASDPANLAVAEGSGFRVEARNPPENASGWNVYVGSSPTDTRRQNDNPLDPGAIWEKSDSTLADGVVPGDGQTADVFLTQRRILQRG